MSRNGNVENFGFDPIGVDIHPDDFCSVAHGSEPEDNEPLSLRWTTEDQSNRTAVSPPFQQDRHRLAKNHDGFDPIGVDICPDSCDLNGGDFNHNEFDDSVDFPPWDHIAKKSKTSPSSSSESRADQNKADASKVSVNSTAGQNLESTKSSPSQIYNTIPFASTSLKSQTTQMLMPPNNPENKGVKRPFQVNAPLNVQTQTAYKGTKKIDGKRPLQVHSSKEVKWVVRKTPSQETSTVDLMQTMLDRAPPRVTRKVAETSAQESEEIPVKSTTHVNALPLVKRKATQTAPQRRNETEVKRTIQVRPSKVNRTAANASSQARNEVEVKGPLNAPPIVKKTVTRTLSQGRTDVEGKRPMQISAPPKMKGVVEPTSSQKRSEAEGKRPTQLNIPPQAKQKGKPILPQKINELGVKRTTQANVRLQVKRNGAPALSETQVKVPPQVTKDGKPKQSQVKHNNHRKGSTHPRSNRLAQTNAEWSRRQNALAMPKERLEDMNHIRMGRRQKSKTYGQQPNQSWTGQNCCQYYSSHDVVEQSRPTMNSFHSPNIPHKNNFGSGRKRPRQQGQGHRDSNNWGRMQRRRFEPHFWDGVSTPQRPPNTIARDPRIHRRPSNQNSQEAPLQLCGGFQEWTRQFAYQPSTLSPSYSTCNERNMHFATSQFFMRSSLPVMEHSCADNAEQASLRPFDRSSETSRRKRVQKKARKRAKKGDRRKSTSQITEGEHSEREVCPAVAKDSFEAGCQEVDLQPADGDTSGDSIARESSKWHDNKEKCQAGGSRNLDLEKNECFGSKASPSAIEKTVVINLNQESPTTPTGGNALTQSVSQHDHRTLKDSYRTSRICEVENGDSKDLLVTCSQQTYVCNDLIAQREGDLAADSCIRESTWTESQNHPSKDTPDFLGSTEEFGVGSANSLEEYIDHRNRNTLAHTICENYTHVQEWDEAQSSESRKKIRVGNDTHECEENQNGFGPKSEHGQGILYDPKESKVTCDVETRDIPHSECILETDSGIFKVSVKASQDLRESTCQTVVFQVSQPLVAYSDDSKASACRGFQEVERNRSTDKDERDHGTFHEDKSQNNLETRTIILNCIVETKRQCPEANEGKPSCPTDQSTVQAIMSAAPNPRKNTNLKGLKILGMLIGQYRKKKQEEKLLRQRLSRKKNLEDKSVGEKLPTEPSEELEKVKGANQHTIDHFLSDNMGTKEEDGIPNSLNTMFDVVTDSLEEKEKEAWASPLVANIPGVDDAGRPLKVGKRSKGRAMSEDESREKKRGRALLQRRVHGETIFDDKCTEEKFQEEENAAIYATPGEGFRERLRDGEASGEMAAVNRCMRSVQTNGGRQLGIRANGQPHKVRNWPKVSQASDETCVKKSSDDPNINYEEGSISHHRNQIEGGENNGVESRQNNLQNGRFSTDEKADPRDKAIDCSEKKITGKSNSTKDRTGCEVIDLSAVESDHENDTQTIGDRFGIHEVIEIIDNRAEGTSCIGNGVGKEDELAARDKRDMTSEKVAKPKSSSKPESEANMAVIKEEKISAFLEHVHGFENHRRTVIVIDDDDDFGQKGDEDPTSASVRQDGRSRNQDLVSDFVAASSKPKRFKPQRQKKRSTLSGDTCKSEDQKQESSSRNRAKPSQDQPLPNGRNIPTTERRYVFHPMNNTSTSKKPAPTNPAKKIDWFERNFSFMFSPEDALKEQERLLEQSAARVRSQAQAQVVSQADLARDKSISFSEVITDVHKRFPNHWKYSDRYARLGLPKDASSSLVKAQYRRLALIYHPDKSRAESTATKFQAVTEAYRSLLSD